MDTATLSVSIEQAEARIGRAIRAVLHDGRQVTGRLAAVNTVGGETRLVIETVPRSDREHHVSLTSVAVLHVRG